MGFFYARGPQRNGHASEEPGIGYSCDNNVDSMITVRRLIRRAHLKRSHECETLECDEATKVTSVPFQVARADGSSPPDPGSPALG